MFLNDRSYLLVLFVNLLTFHKLIIAWYTNDLSYTFLFTWDDDTNYRDNLHYKQPIIQYLRSGHAFDSLINVWEPASWIFKCIVWNLTNGSSLSYRMCGFVLHLLTSIAIYWILQYILNMRTNDVDDVDDVVNVKNDIDKKEEREEEEEEEENYDEQNKDDDEEEEDDDDDNNNNNNDNNNNTNIAALIGTLWYTIHPLHVEVICWPSALPYALASFFHVAALYVYICAPPPLSSTFLYPSPSIGLYRIRNPYYCATVLLTILSICSKSAALLAAPASFLAIDMIRKSPFNDNQQLPILYKQPFRWFKYAIQHHLWIGITIFLLLVVTIWANFGGMESDIDVTSITNQQRFIKAPMLIIKCIRDVLFPINLAPHYMLRFEMLDPLKSSLCIMSFATLPLCCLLVHVVYNGNAGIVWISLTLVPVLGLVQHGYICFGSDRLWQFVLLPFAAVVSILIKNVLKLPVFQPSKSRWILYVVATILLCGIARITSLQTLLWKNDETLWKTSLQIDPTDWRAADQLVEHYIGQENFEAARPHLISIQLYSPSDGLKAELHQAKLLLMQGLTEEACTIYKDLSETNFEESGARGAIYNNNGVCCLHRSDLENAKDWFQRGLSNTIHSRHLRTLHGNQNELLRALKEDPEKAKGYSGKHSLIF